MTDFYTLIYLHDSLIGLLIQRTILTDLTPIMSDFNASNSKHTISWIADLQTTVDDNVIFTEGYMVRQCWTHNRSKARILSGCSPCGPRFTSDPPHLSYPGEGGLQGIQRDCRWIHDCKLVLAEFQLEPAHTFDYKSSCSRFPSHAPTSTKEWPPTDRGLNVESTAGEVKLRFCISI